MTNKELITKLLEFPMDKEIKICTGGEYFDFSVGWKGQKEQRETCVGVVLFVDDGFLEKSMIEGQK